MGLFSWLFGRKKKNKLQQYVHFRPGVSKTSGRDDGRIGTRLFRDSDNLHDSSDLNPHRLRDEIRSNTHKAIIEEQQKKKNPDYWNSPDFPQDSYYGNDNSSHLHEDNKHSASSSSIPNFHGFDGGKFGGGGASHSWDQQDAGQHSGNHGSQSSHDASHYDSGGGSSSDASGSSDSGSGDSGGGDSSGGGD